MTEGCVLWTHEQWCFRLIYLHLNNSSILTGFSEKTEQTNSPDVVVGQWHVHVLTNPQMLRVEQLALRGLQIPSKSIQSQKPSFPAMGRGLVAPQELPASLSCSQRQTLLRLQKQAEVLRIQTLPVLGQLHH